MMPKQIYAGTDYMKNPANQKPVGTGPFMFQEWKRGEYIKLVRNPNYWKKGQPYLDELVFNVIPDSASRAVRSEEHTSELQSLMRISYAVFCLKKKKPTKRQHMKYKTKSN